ncbi:hypothetical protein E2C01_090761 [Portunus trituberculatus]|uniref:Uncharacterized protein n=2 Tax=Portunus trituberculatus TaxID=210409 RepID=A0A5B7JT95_PORTR|nr:hypothetical protein [Portunus trituberculatus]
MGCQGSKGRVDAEANKYLLETVTGHTDSINCMVLSEDESVLVTGDDKEARLWDVEGGQGGPTEAMGSLK